MSPDAWRNSCSRGLYQRSSMKKKRGRDARENWLMSLTSRRSSRRAHVVVCSISDTLLGGMCPIWCGR